MAERGIETTSQMLIYKRADLPELDGQRLSDPSDVEFVKALLTRVKLLEPSGEVVTIETAITRYLGGTPFTLYNSSLVVSYHIDLRVNEEERTVSLKSGFPGPKEPFKRIGMQLKLAITPAFANMEHDPDDGWRGIFME